MEQSRNIMRQSLQYLYDAREISNIADCVLEHLLHTDRTHLLMERNSVLSESVHQQVEAIAMRLHSGEPLQYILGAAPFYGMDLRVSPAVLIPRPETEELVEWILSEHDKHPRRVLDMGTGSGCIALALAQNRPSWSVEAIDISNEALDLARKNADENGIKVDFRQEDILQMPSQQEIYDIIVSNPPYITPSEKKQMHCNVLDFEPHQALFVPEDDPLLFYRAIARFASTALKPGGRLYFEINRRFGRETLDMIQQESTLQPTLRKDISQNDRMIMAVKF